MDDAPSEIQITPNVDEETRVSLRGAFGSPIIVIISVVFLMISIFLLFFAAAVITGSQPDYVSAAIAVVLALTLPIASYFRLRLLIHNRIKAAVDASGRNEAVFSEDAITFRDAYKSVASIGFTSNGRATFPRA